MSLNVAPPRPICTGDGAGGACRRRASHPGCSEELDNRHPCRHQPQACRHLPEGCQRIPVLSVVLTQGVRIAQASSLPLATTTTTLLNPHSSHKVTSGPGIAMKLSVATRPAIGFFSPASPASLAAHEHVKLRCWLRAGPPKHWSIDLL